MEVVYDDVVVQQMRAQLEAQLQNLRQELLDKGQQHKQELVNLRLARDQEKLTTETEFNIQVSRT
jgi:hypothetical protein